MTSIDVLITSYNRCDKTLACLESLAAQVDTEADVRTVLVDSGSTDGTPEQVGRCFPEVTVVRVGSDVYWGRGMRIAGEHARSSADFHLWLNDDVILSGDALATLLALGHPDRIIVGKLHDHQGRPSYGGLVSRRWRRLSMTPAPESDQPQQVDTLNGNVVLVGRAVRQVIGGVRGNLFPHAFGDIDYGYIARRHGFAVIQAPGTVGECSRNPLPASRRLPTLLGRWRALVSTKELPPSMWWRACLRYGGLLAPVYFVRPYLRVLLSVGASS